MFPSIYQGHLCYDPVASSLSLLVAQSLFDGNGFMRYAKKSNLAKAMISDKSLISTENGKSMLVDQEVEVTFDGGALVNLVGWPRKCNISVVLQNYWKYI